MSLGLMLVLFQLINSLLIKNINFKAKPKRKIILFTNNCQQTPPWLEEHFTDTLL